MAWKVRCREPSKYCTQANTKIPLGVGVGLSIESWIVRFYAIKQIKTRSKTVSFKRGSDINFHGKALWSSLARWRDGSHYFGHCWLLWWVCEDSKSCSGGLVLLSHVVVESGSQPRILLKRHWQKPRSRLVNSASACFCLKLNLGRDNLCIRVSSCLVPIK